MVGSAELPLNGVDAIFYCEVVTIIERKFDCNPYNVLRPPRVAASSLFFYGFLLTILFHPNDCSLYTKL